MDSGDTHILRQLVVFVSAVVAFAGYMTLVLRDAPWFWLVPLLAYTGWAMVWLFKRVQ